MMRFGFAVLLVMPLLAQRPSTLQKHEAVTIEGIVTDQAGNPIEAARIDHGLDIPYPAGPSTDAQGRFTVRAEGAAIVIRKAGFDSYFLRLDEGSPVKVVMKAFQAWPECVSAAAIFPDVNVVNSRDVDYSSTSRILRTQDGPKVLRDGKGPSWSFGIPSTRDVWSSVEYVEHVEEVNGPVWLIDARGKTKEGKYWQYRGMFGQSSEYHDVTQPTAALMDRLIGGHCPLF